MNQTENQLNYLLHKSLDDDEAEALRLGMSNLNDSNCLVRESAERMIKAVFDIIKRKQVTIYCFKVVDYKLIMGEN